MKPRTNPFAPGAGTQPPELSGRDDLIERAAIALDRIRMGRAARSFIIYVLRGVGKAVLLDKMCGMCTAPFVVMAYLAFVSTPAIAGANYLKPGFAMPADHKPVVLVLPPKIEINAQGKQGEEIPNPEWFKQAHENVRLAVMKSLPSRFVSFRFSENSEASITKANVDAFESYKWRTGEIIFKVPQGTMPVTTGKKGQYDYNIGAGVAASIRAAFPDADYGLIMNQHDTYATGGQILGEILGATIGGIAAPQGTSAPMRNMRPHYGNALLFDVNTGDVIWFHGDGAFGGDLRKPESAQVRIDQALTKFPLPKTAK